MWDDCGHRLGHDTLAPDVGMQDKPDFIDLVQACGADNTPLHFNREVSDGIRGLLCDAVQFLCGLAWGAMGWGGPVTHGVNIAVDREHIVEIIRLAAAQNKPFGSQHNTLQRKGPPIWRPFVI